MKLRRAAVYTSVLYGEDFILDSLRSILPHVDRAFVIMMGDVWGRSQGVTYKGEWVPWPEFEDVGLTYRGKSGERCTPVARVFDRTRDIIRAMGDDRVEIVEAYKDTPWNRWGFAVNDILRGERDTRYCLDLDEVVLIDPDCVFRSDQAAAAFAAWDAHPEYRWASCGQVELWRTPLWEVSRPRSMVSFHRGDLSLISSPEPPVKRTRPVPETHQLPAVVHNFGFCVSERSMRWKHLTALSFWARVGESQPNEDWLDKKWLSWHPRTNNRDLEVSVRCESAIPEARPYDPAQLPESIRARLDAGEWSSLEESFR